MKIFFDIALLFLIGSLLGWVIELLFRRFFSAKKWINPGFLSGPYLPLYGCGTVVLYGICTIPVPLWAQIVLIVVLMTAIEYVTGLIFIKGMKIKLWDYSMRWGNIQGIICPLFSLLWGGLGVIFRFFVFPYLTESIFWLDTHTPFLFVLGLFYGVFLIDVCTSFNFSLKIRKALDEIKAVVRYEELKYYIKVEQEKLKKHASFLFAFRSEHSLAENIRSVIRRRREGDKEGTEGPPADNPAEEEVNDARPETSGPDEQSK